MGIILDVLDLPRCFTLYQAQQEIRAFCNNQDEQDLAGNVLWENFRIYLTPELRWRIDGTNDFWGSHSVVLSDSFAKWLNIARTVW